MNITPIQFQAHESGPTVSALLQMPDDPIGMATLSHGAGAGITHPNMENISAALARHNLATLRYQFPFMERGGGREKPAVSISTVRQACATANQLAPNLPIIAGGHSYGGRMTSMAAAEQAIPNICGLFFCNYPLHPAKKPSRQRALHLPSIDVPMLFLSGTRDRMMTYDLLEPTLHKLGSLAEFEWLETGDHSYATLKRIRDPKDDIFDQIARLITQWFLRIQ